MHLLKSVVLSLGFLISATLSFAQTNAIEIKFIGNCGMLLTDGESNIYVDFPYKSGAHKYAEYSPAQMDSIPDNAIFIFTHKHSDHYSRKLVKQVKKNNKGNVFGPWNSEELEKLNSINGFSVKAFDTKHRYSFDHRSYLITWHGKRFYFSGDTETADTADTLAALDNINVAFVPRWLLQDARDRDISLETELLVIYHIGPLENITTQNPKIILLNTEGQRLSIPY